MVTKKDNQAPASMADLLAFMEGMTQQITTLHDDNLQWKNEVVEEIHASEKRMQLHFDAAVENIRHDLEGANRDEIESIKDRVARLEEHAGFHRV